MEGIAIRRLISAHPEEYNQLLEKAEADVPEEESRQVRLGDKPPGTVSDLLHLVSQAAMATLLGD
ncbi:hypothetical protein ACFVT1_40300 [Streptomyces sp. NPDC057963]|uniref:hypothetical protein n=1 Tax=Streptomyces sp. NPDC057963 TaxID=3346290 RepID=UPI0036E3D9CD